MTTPDQHPLHLMKQQVSAQRTETRPPSPSTENTTRNTIATHTKLISPGQPTTP